MSKTSGECILELAQAHGLKPAEIAQRVQKHRPTLAVEDAMWLVQRAIGGSGMPVVVADAIIQISTERARSIATGEQK